MTLSMRLMHLIPTEHCILEPMKKASTTDFTFNPCYLSSIVAILLQHFILISRIKQTVPKSVTKLLSCMPQQIGLLFYFRVLCIVVQIGIGFYHLYTCINTVCHF